MVFALWNTACFHYQSWLSILKVKTESHLSPLIDLLSNHLLMLTECFLCAQHPTLFIFTTILQMCVINIPKVQRWKLRLMEVKSWGHIANRWQNSLDCKGPHMSSRFWASLTPVPNIFTFTRPLESTYLPPAAHMLFLASSFTLHFLVDFTRISVREKSECFLLHQKNNPLEQSN